VSMNTTSVWEGGGGGTDGAEWENANRIIDERNGELLLLVAEETRE
jgi:hypothetical protein